MEWRTQSAEGFASDPYAVCRKAEKRSISDLQSEQQPETYKSRIEACREAILETGKAIFWQKCISRQPEKNDKEVNQMYEVQKELYVYLDSLEDLKHYAEKKKRIDAEIEKAEEEHAREAALYAQQKKEDALRNAEMMGVIFGAEMEAYLLARDFAEEIKEDPCCIVPLQMSIHACEYTVGLQICARLHRTYRRRRMSMPYDFRDNRTNYEKEKEVREKRLSAYSEDIQKRTLEQSCD